MRAKSEESPTIVGDLAFDVTNSACCEIFVPEDMGLSPYLVLTSRYGGKDGYCLLLRKELLPNLVKYGTMPEAPYYGTCYIDSYLNSEFAEFLSDEVIALVLNTDIVITASSSIWYDGSELESISRRFFLLSATECGFKSYASPLVEGEPIAYFDNDIRRIVKLNNEATAWWLRTPNTKNAFAWCVSYTGDMTFLDIETELGVRPAFCLPAETPVIAFNVDGVNHYLLGTPDISKYAQNLKK